MKTLSTRFQRRRNITGMALVWALLLCAVLAGIVVAFLGGTSQALRVANMDVHSVTADELMSAAQQEILAKLSDGFAIESGTGAKRKGHTTAGPGLLEVRRYDMQYNRGIDIGAAAFLGTAEAPAFFSQPFSATYNTLPANPRWVPLFSWTQFAPRLRYLTVEGGTPKRPNPDYNPALSFNLNTPTNPFTPSVCLLSGLGENTALIVREKNGTDYATTGNEAGFTLSGSQTAAERPVWVQWVPVHQDPTQPASNSNPVIGRYAYWVDVENTKLKADRPLTAMRNLPLYARLLGEPDAVDSGAGSWITQGATNSALLGRALAERSLAPSDGQYNSNGVSMRRDGTQGLPYSAAAAAEARNAWLGWQGNLPPAAAGTHVVDWDYFEAPWPTGSALLTVGAQLSSLQRSWNTGGAATRPLNPWNLGVETAAAPSAMESLLRQVAVSGLTFEGYEEDVDPLGLPKLDLVQFQLDATAGNTAVVSLQNITDNPIMERLTDTAYSAAYFPGNWASGGLAKSFSDTWNRYAGNGVAGNTSNGRAAALQMLVNIAEASQPSNVPPLIDPINGIVGARSMPYVAEVTTRARSALWLLPEADRNNPAVLLKKEGGVYTYTYKQKRLHYYATSVIIELCIGFINPNPFETEAFTGEIEVDATWVSTNNQIIKEVKPYKATLNDIYTVTPTAGKDFKQAQVHGKTAFIKLGVVPVSVLDEAVPIQIKGWRIKKGSDEWHRVPVRSPGSQTAPRLWYNMTQYGANAGTPEDPRSFAFVDEKGNGSFMTNSANTNRALGWFGRNTLANVLDDTVFVSGWTNPNALTNPTLEGQLQQWLEQAKRATILERIYCYDPVLGHRTGNSSLAGTGGNGHFYGALGHTWRRGWVSNSDPRANAPTNGSDIEIRKLLVQDWQINTAQTSSANVTVQRPVGNLLQTQTTTLNMPQVTATPQGQTVYEYLTHKKIVGNGVSDEVEPLRFLTAAYLSASVAGPQPQGNIYYDYWYKDLLKYIWREPGNHLEWFDLETTASFDSTQSEEQKRWLKGSDGKKGLRSLLCSAPPGRPFVSVGEIGFCHSGFPLTPIIVTPEEGRNEYQLNSPRNGPPMRMLLDLFKPRPVVNNAGSALSQAEWIAGAAAATQRHTWNINTSIAHDDYMALREGGVALAEPKSSVNPVAMPAHAVWLPNAVSYARRAEGSEAYRAKEAKEIVTKNPGYMQDRHLRPGPALARPWNMWIGVVGADISPSRSGESSLWGVGNNITQYFGPGLMSWEPGLGAASATGPWVDFGSEPPGFGRLLAFGVDGRADDAIANPAAAQRGWLAGRFASDNNINSLQPDQAFYLPAHFQTRHALFPMRHFVSDLAVDFQQPNHESNWANIKTALNPGISAESLPTGGEDDSEEAKRQAEKMDGAAFPGGFHRAGVYYQAPMSLLTNQASTSANAFSAYIIVQTVKDKGTVRTGITKSGPGYVDPDDVVLAERWARVLIRKEVSSPGAVPNFRVISAEVANR